MRVNCSNRLAVAASEGAADGYGKQQVENQIKSGALRSVKIAGRRFVTRAALLELLNLGGE